MIIDLRDYVPPDIFTAFKSKSCQFIDPRIILLHNFLSDRYNVRAIVNNWHLGGKLKERGFRVPTSAGSVLSQHKYGRALDFTIPGISAIEVYDDLMMDQTALLGLGVTTIEDIAYTKKGNWIHLDLRTWDEGVSKDKLKIVVP